MKLCKGVRETRAIWERNPVTGPERLNHDDTWDGDVRQRGVKRKRLTCPVCKRRLMSSIRVCHDGCCVVHSLPPHKPKGWWKRKRRKK